MKTTFTSLLIIIYLNVNAQVSNRLSLSSETKAKGLTFYDFSKQSQIKIDGGLSEKVYNNKKMFTSDRCDIYVKSIRDSVEVCVYFYSKDTLIINGQKMPFKNNYK